MISTDNYRILQVSPFFPPDVGGISSHVYNLSVNLTKYGDSIFIATPKRFLHGRKEVSNLDQQHILHMNSIYLLGWGRYATMRNVSFPIDFGNRLRSIIRKGNFDAIHIHGIHYPTSWIAINAAYNHGVPSVVTVHGTYGLNPRRILDGKTMLEEWMYKHLFVKLLSKTNVIIGPTNKIIKFVKDLGVKSDNYFTVPNGIDTSKYIENLTTKKVYRDKYNINQDAIVILFRGRFEHIKGILEFAEAIKNVLKHTDKRVEVVIVGSGSLESRVHSILQHVERVQIFNWQPQEEIHELYIASDIYVIPSLSEGQGITVIEAMNACLHIVYSPVGGVPETLQGYTLKTILREVSSEEIGRVLISLLESSRSEFNLADSISYARSFDWKNTSLEIRKVYSGIVQGNT